MKQTPPEDRQYDEERIASLCGQTTSEKISIKRTRNRVDTFFCTNGVRFIEIPLYIYLYLMLF